MENLIDLWAEEDLYELINDYLVAIGRSDDENRFQKIVRNFKEDWNYDTCNRMLAHMIETVYDIHN